MKESTIIEAFPEWYVHTAVTITTIALLVIVSMAILFGSHFLYFISFKKKNMISYGR